MSSINNKFPSCEILVQDMYGVDQFLIACTIATLFWMVATVYLQKKLHIYTLFLGKKYALTVHAIIMSIVALQQLVMTAFDYRSKWLFTTALWPLGNLVFAASLTLVAAALYETGPGILIGTEAFGRHKPHKGRVWHRLKQPLAIGFGGAYIGLGLLTGHIVYLIVGVIVGLGLIAVDVTRRMIMK